MKNLNSQKKGWLALDIDGTLTAERHLIPQPVCDYLKEKEAEGWSIAVATGRPFAFAVKPLSRFSFPFVFLGQNGSLALEMPERRLLFSHYIPKENVALIEEAYAKVDADFLLYSGYDRGDVCYFRPLKLKEEDLRYVQKTAAQQKNHWEGVDVFPSIDTPLIKGFGVSKVLDPIQKKLAEGPFQVSGIRDPSAPQVRWLLITDEKASKGLGLREIFQLKGRGEQVIAAGDDENDESLFMEADVCISMPNAPQKLLAKADTIAPPVEEMGIITALKRWI